MSIENKIFTEFQQGRLDIFYKELYPGLLLFAGKYLGDKKIYAEDCVQNAIFKAWQKKGDFDSGYALKSFLYVTIRNEIISIHRNNSVKNKYFENQRILEDQESFVTSVIDQEAKTLLFNLINKLPAKEREVCRLSYIDGVSNTEISETLGISLATVKRHKSKSVEILREVFKDLMILGIILRSSL